MSAVTSGSDRAAAHIAPVELALLASVFVIAACGLVYELAAGALASYLLGDSVLQFSTVIGTYLFAMGVGSWLSRFIERQLVAQFLRIELLVGLVGGLMPAALFALQSVAAPSFRAALYALVLVVGVLVGLEIPLVMRILKRHFRERYALKDLVSHLDLWLKGFWPSQSAPRQWHYGPQCFCLLIGPCQLGRRHPLACPSEPGLEPFRGKRPAGKDISYRGWLRSRPFRRSSLPPRNASSDT